MRDLHLSYAILDQIDAMGPLLRSVLAVDIASASFRAEVAARDVRLSQVLLTALVRNAMDGSLSADPIEASRLEAVRSAIIDGRPGRLREEFRDGIQRLMAARLDQATRLASADFVNSCLNVLEEDFAELGRQIDPRFLRSLLVRRG